MSASDASRRAALAAMDIGPVWLLRTARSGATVLDDDADIDFGIGPADPAWLVIGDGLSADTGFFDGPAGRLLDAMLAAVDHDRQRDVHVAPIPQGVDARSLVLRRIAALAPPIVVIAGEEAARLLLGPDTTLEQARGTVHDLSSIPAVVTLHPDDLLATPQDKAKAWADLCLARRTHAARAVGR